MNGYTLEQVTEEKDLGIIIDKELKFHKHTAMAIKKANIILGLIKKSFVNLDTNSLPLLYTGCLPSQESQGSQGNVREFHLSEKSEKMSGKSQGILFV